MDALLQCDICRHPAPAHAGGGCSFCACSQTLEHVIEQGLEAARDEIRRMWNGPPNDTMGYRGA